MSKYKSISKLIRNYITLKYGDDYSTQNVSVSEMENYICDLLQILKDNKILDDYSLKYKGEIITLRQMELLYRPFGEEKEILMSIGF